MPDLKPVLCPVLSTSAPQIRHGFFTRRGGVSKGLYDSLNIGPSSKDDPKDVRQNRKSIVSYLGLNDDDVVTPWQHHSADVEIVSENWGNARKKADGLVTNKPNLPLAIVTADCGPILFSDAKNQIIGTAHAGWRGAVSGVLENMVETMISLGAQKEDIHATLGPTISRSNYEVGPEFVTHFVTIDPLHERYFMPSKNPDHAYFDLPEFIVDRLKKLGISANWTGNCTYGEEDNFFSYRRMTHRGEPDYGRQISAIAIIK